MTPDSGTKKRAQGGPSEPTWTLATSWRGLAFVVHRGHAYPRRFDATWTRGDGATVRLHVRVDEERGPLPERVEVDGLPGGLAGLLRGLPVAAMTRTAAAQLAFEPGTAAKSWKPAEAGPVPMGPVGARPKRQPQHKRLDEVAARYWEAVGLGAKVLPYLQRNLWRGHSGQPLSADHIYHLIHQCRTTKRPGSRKTYLPPTRQGRKARLEDLKPQGRKP